MPNETAPTNVAATAAPPSKVTLASAQVHSQLVDALALSNHAVSTGFKTSAGEPLLFGDIGVIQGTAAALGMFDPPAEGETRSPAPSVTVAEWIAFEQAYYRLAAAMSPVTAETLGATEATMPGSGGSYRLLDQLLGYSPALRFTRMFALVAITLGAFVIIGECLVYVFGQEADTSKYLWQKNILESLLPWTYGALGSCAYLLRSGHYFIYERSFDLRRKPEYFNRVLLGAISGGAIILFVNYLVDDGGTVLHLSSAALGFVAGYSTDFLFNTIERVVAAIFPKTDGDPKVQPSKAVAKPGTVSGNGNSPDDSGNGDDKPDELDNQGKQRKPPKKTSKTSAPGDDAGGSGVQS
jgi:hypothetical protein